MATRSNAYWAICLAVSLAACNSSTDAPATTNILKNEQALSLSGLPSVGTSTFSYTSDLGSGFRTVSLAIGNDFAPENFCQGATIFGVDGTQACSSCSMVVNSNLFRTLGSSQMYSSAETALGIPTQFRSIPKIDLDDDGVNNPNTAVPSVSAFYAGIVQAVNPGLASYWKMDDSSNSTSLADSAFVNNPGTYHKKAVRSAGAMAGSYSAYFDGINYFLVTNSGATYTSGAGGALSVELWFNNQSADPNTTAYLFSWKTASAKEFSISLLGTTLNVNLNGNILATSSVAVKVWHHIVVSKSAADGTGTLVYLDGVLVSNGNFGGSTLTTDWSATNFRFAIGPTNGAFNGYLDEIAFYVTALSAAEVSKHYLAGRSSNNRSKTISIPSSAHSAFVPCGNTLAVADGSPLTTVDERAAECEDLNGSTWATWDGQARGISGEGKWRLVTVAANASNGAAPYYEVWQDLRTNLLWSSRTTIPVPQVVNANSQVAGSWCGASGNSDPSDPFAACVNNQTSYCSEVLSSNPTGKKVLTGPSFVGPVAGGLENYATGAYSGAKGGLGLKSSPSVYWRLPTLNDYQQADVDGIRFVMPDMGASAFTGTTSSAQATEWTATIDSNVIGRANAFVFGSAEGTTASLIRTATSALPYVRCVGRY